MNNNKLIREVLFNGCLYSVNNTEGYDIGVGYGCGRQKEFYYPYSSALERSYCHVTTEEINAVVKELESEGYEFVYDEEYVFMKGERKAFAPFKPSKPHLKDKERVITAKTDPVEYYCDRLFTECKDGNLRLL